MSRFLSSGGIIRNPEVQSLTVKLVYGYKNYLMMNGKAR